MVGHKDKQENRYAQQTYATLVIILPTQSYDF